MSAKEIPLKKGQISHRYEGNRSYLTKISNTLWINLSVEAEKMDQYFKKENIRFKKNGSAFSDS